MPEIIKLDTVRMSRLLIAEIENNYGGVQMKYAKALGITKGAVNKVVCMDADKMPHTKIMKDMGWKIIKPAAYVVAV